MEIKAKTFVTADSATPPNIIAGSV